MKKLNQKGAVSMGGVLLMAIGLVFLSIGFLVFPIVISGTDAILNSTDTQIDAGLVTTGNVTTGDMPLSRTLWQSDVANVVSISSNATETPVADNYTGGSLYFTSLSGNITRLLTVHYLRGSIDDYTGLRGVIGVSPMIVLIGFIAGGVITGFMGIKIMREG